MNTLTCKLPQCTLINTLQSLDGSIVHQCINHKFSPEWVPLASMPPHTLGMHSTNSNQVLSLHTHNALNQFKSSALLTHLECTQPTQIRCSPYTPRMHSSNQMKCIPYTLRMHSTNPNEVLSLHTQSALNDLNSNAFLTHSECTQSTQMKCYLLTHSECTQSTQIKTYNAGICTHAHPMLLGLD